RGYDAPEQSVIEEIARRDRIDSQRETAPLRPAPDAIIIDTTGKTPDETIAEVARLVAEKLKGLPESRGS
ncbi:MAG: (d)CMP kinase, partial [Bacillota bacterium]